MAKFVCTVCGYVYEGDSAPEKCPVCGVGADKFVEQSGEMTWAAEHVVGVAQAIVCLQLLLQLVFELVLFLLRGTYELLSDGGKFVHFVLRDVNNVELHVTPPPRR